MDENEGGNEESSKQDQPRAPTVTKGKYQAAHTTNIRGNQKTQNSKNTVDTALVRWTRIVGIFTGLLFIAAVLQFCAMRGQMNVMQGQLDAMKADQRPLVFATNIIISRPVVHDEKGLNIALRFDLKNGGHSPALQTVARFRAYLRSLNYRTEEGIVCKDAEPAEFGNTLFADSPISLETGWLIPTQEIEAAKKLGTMIVPFIVACVAYQFPGTREYHTSPYEFLISPAVGSTKWPCCGFPIDEKEIQPANLQLTLVPVAAPD